ncbi:unnamed protein product [Arctia plantaginis]|uniref:Uncharacterized protein n=1 Tax=Arctia plantaginis TaxID=874455 RepID=A0A8S0ZI36_ARCPL|nr:unnamed protein product [Arctia plantaginis]
MSNKKLSDTEIEQFLDKPSKNENGHDFSDTESANDIATIRRNLDQAVYYTQCLEAMQIGKSGWEQGKKSRGGAPTKCTYQVKEPSSLNLCMVLTDAVGKNLRREIVIIINHM